MGNCPLPARLNTGERRLVRYRFALAACVFHLLVLILNHCCNWFFIHRIVRVFVRHLKHLCGTRCHAIPAPIASVRIDGDEICARTVTVSIVGLHPSFPVFLVILSGVRRIPVGRRVSMGKRENPSRFMCDGGCSPEETGSGARTFPLSRLHDRPEQCGPYEWTTLELIVPVLFPSGTERIRRGQRLPRPRVGCPTWSSWVPVPFSSSAGR